MKRFTFTMALGALMLCGSTVLAGEKIVLPTGKAVENPRMVAAAERGTVPVTDVAYRWRGGPRAYYGYRAYRPYYGGYGYGYGGYYTRPYYGYGPGWGYGGAYGWGPGVGIGVGPAWGPGVGVGIGPMARFGGGYYW